MSRRVMFAVGAAVLLCQPAGAGMILLDDGFDDAARTNAVLPDSASWLAGRASGDCFVRDGSLAITNIAANGNGVLAYFAPPGSPIRLGAGQSIRLSFDYGFAATNAGDWGFMFGLFDSGGSRADVDNTAFNLGSGAFRDYVGYAAAGVFGQSGSYRYKLAERSTNMHNGLFVSAAYSTLSNGVAQTAGTHAGQSYSAWLEIAYQSLGVASLACDIGGQTLSNRMDVSGILDEYDCVGIGINLPVQGVWLDNIRVVVIPEPRAAGVAACVACWLAGMARRPSPGRSCCAAEAHRRASLLRFLSGEAGQKLLGPLRGG